MTTKYGGFKASQATPDEIIAFARLMRGKSLRELVPASGLLGESRRSDKGAVGQLVERAFGLPRSNRQGPDFEHAEVELKAVPLKRGNRTVRTKERTNITMIDYATLVDETWARAKVRNKLEKILFVFYFHIDNQDALDAVVEETVLWTPSEDLLPQMERDWSVVRQKVIDGLAHKISEADGLVLGAATKGAGGGKLVSQPHNPGERAKSRAWALKPSLTTWLYEKEAGCAKAIVSLGDTLGLQKDQDFESIVIERLSAFQGLSLEQVARRLKVPISKAKSGAAILVRRAIGVIDNAAAISEFRERGIRIKIVPVALNGRPYEAMSFPAFNHMEVWKEEWEESDLLEHLNRLLIIPLIRPERTTPKDEQRWGPAFFWSPSADQLQGIEAEWRDYVSRIEAGESRALPSSASTNFIHVRPHARDSGDIEPAPKVGNVVKKSFWLNTAFLTTLIRHHGVDTLPIRNTKRSTR